MVYTIQVWLEFCQFYDWSNRWFKIPPNYLNYIIKFFFVSFRISFYSINLLFGITNISSYTILYIFFVDFPIFCILFEIYEQCFWWWYVVCVSVSIYISVCSSFFSHDEKKMWKQIRMLSLAKHFQIENSITKTQTTCHRRP